VQRVIFTLDHTKLHRHIWQDSPGRGIGPLQKPLPVKYTAVTRNKHVPAAGFKPATPESKRPQIYASDIAATGIG